MTLQRKPAWRACPRCRRAQSVCYCSRITPFETDPLLVLLVHPKETRKAIGTARIVELAVRGSRIWRGRGPELDQDRRLRDLLEDPSLFPVVVFPGPGCLNLSHDPWPADWPKPVSSGSPDGRRMAYLLIDGSWSLASKMIRTSRVLSALPQVSFELIAPSRYRIRQQPGVNCLSTVEAVHRLLEVLHARGHSGLPARREHDSMLEVFDWMVETQLRLEAEARQQRQRPVLFSEK